MVISRLQAVIGATILIVATATVSVIVVFKWNPLPPMDYEDCAGRAAKDAKSKDALSVLLSICGSEFKGRRKLGGGYAYFDDCQERAVEIKGPNPTSTELSAIKQQCFAYMEARAQVEAEEERRAAKLAEQRRREQQVAQEAREQQRRIRKFWLMTDVQVRPTGFTTKTSWTDWVDMKIEVTNRSKEALSDVSVGVAFVPIGSARPSSYADTHDLYMKLSPGETRTDKIEGIDAELTKRRICLAVLDVRLSDE